MTGEARGEVRAYRERRDATAPPERPAEGARGADRVGGRRPEAKVDALAPRPATLHELVAELWRERASREQAGTACYVSPARRIGDESRCWEPATVTCSRFSETFVDFLS